MSGVLSIIVSIGIAALTFANGWIMFTLRERRQEIDRRFGEIGGRFKGVSDRLHGLGVETNLTAGDLGRLKVEVAKEYVRHDAVLAMETRIIARLDRQEGKLDRVLGDRG